MLRTEDVFSVFAFTVVRLVRVRACIRAAETLRSGALCELRNRSLRITQASIYACALLSPRTLRVLPAAHGAASAPVDRDSLSPCRHDGAAARNPTVFFPASACRVGRTAFVGVLGARGKETRSFETVPKRPAQCAMVRLLLCDGMLEFGAVSSRTAYVCFE